MDIRDLVQSYIDVVIDEYGTSFGMSRARLQYLIKNQNRSLGLVAYDSIFVAAVISYGKIFRKQKINIGDKKFYYRLELDTDFLNQEERALHFNLLDQRDKCWAHSDILIHDRRKNISLNNTQDHSNLVGSHVTILRDRGTSQPKWLSTQKELNFMICGQRSPVAWGMVVETIDRILELAIKMQTTLYENGLNIKEVNGNSVTLEFNCSNAIPDSLH